MTQLFYQPVAVGELGSVGVSVCDDLGELSSLFVQGGFLGFHGGAAVGQFLAHLLHGSLVEFV